MNKAVLYARVSTKEQEEEGYSIPAQIKLLKDYANKNELVINQVFQESESASKSGRKEFSSMIEYVKQSKDIKHVLVEKTDRLLRNLKDYAIAEDLMEDYLVNLHIVKEGEILHKDSRSQTKFIQGIKALMAKNFSDNLSEEVKKGHAEKCEQGEYPANPPHGYTRIDKNTIVINPETSQYVSRAFELYSEGYYSLQRVLEQLYNEGYLYKDTKSKMSKSHLEHLLKNPFYTGFFMFGGKLYQGKHQALVTQDLFDRVQLAFKKDNKPQHSAEHNFAFAGLLTCGECGSTITAEIKKGKYIYYHCTRGKNPDCSQRKYISEAKLEKLFQPVVFNINLDTEQKKWIIQALKESNQDEQQYINERINSLTKQASTLRERINKIYIDKLDGHISEEFWLEKHNEWTGELNKTQGSISAHDKANKDYLEMGAKFLSIAENARDLYLKQTNQEKAKLLKILLSNCTLKDGSLDITYNRPFDILANGLNCTKTLGR